MSSPSHFWSPATSSIYLFPVSGDYLANMFHFVVACYALWVLLLITNLPSWFWYTKQQMTFLVSQLSFSSQYSFHDISGGNKNRYFRVFVKFCCCLLCIVGIIFIQNLHQADFGGQNNNWDIPNVIVEVWPLILLSWEFWI